MYYYGKALIDNQNGPLRIGMTTQNVITVAEVKQAVLAPVVSVRSRDGRKIVYILLDDGTVEEREVTTDLSDGIHTQILSGLKGGEAAITAQLSHRK